MSDMSHKDESGNKTQCMPLSLPVWLWFPSCRLFHLPGGPLLLKPFWHVTGVNNILKRFICSSLRILVLFKMHDDLHWCYYSFFFSWWVQMSAVKKAYCPLCTFLKNVDFSLHECQMGFEKNPFFFLALLVLFDSKLSSQMFWYHVCSQMNNLKKILQMVVDYYNEVSRPGEPNVLWQTVFITVSFNRNMLKIFVHRSS